MVSQAQATPADSLNKILADHWASANKEQIFFRKDPDTFRMNGKSPEISSAGRVRRQAFNSSILKRLNRFLLVSIYHNIPSHCFRYNQQEAVGHSRD